MYVAHSRKIFYIQLPKAVSLRITITTSAITKETITTKFRNDIAHPCPGQQCKCHFNVSIIIRLLQIFPKEISERIYISGWIKYERKKIEISEMQMTGNTL